MVRRGESNTGPKRVYTPSTAHRGREELRAMGARRRDPPLSQDHYKEAFALESTALAAALTVTQTRPGGATGSAV